MFVVAEATRLRHPLSPPKTAIPPAASMLRRLIAVPPALFVLLTCRCALIMS